MRERVAAACEKIMGKEIERKYLLTDLPRGIADGVKISQGYLSVGDPEIRIRRKGGEFFLTRKGGAGFVRDEEEHPISEAAFEILWSLTDGARIEKTRYEIIGDDGLTWEIDEFQSTSRAKLFLAEVELPDEATFPAIPPAVAEVIVRDVTDEAAYKNKNLATNGG